jgi:hypothetical protein
MTANDDAPTPGLAPAFTLELEGGETTRIGRLATGGMREHVSFDGGRLDGERLRGEILPGHSSETWLRRTDGVAVVEAVYLLRTDEGEALRLVGTGYFTRDDVFAGTRMTLVIEVDEGGSNTWLSRTAFVAERPAGASAFQIAAVT